MRAGSSEWKLDMSAGNRGLERWHAQSIAYIPTSWGGISDIRSMLMRLADSGDNAVL